MKRSDFDFAAFLDNESHHIKGTQNSYNTLEDLINFQLLKIMMAFVL